MTAKRPASALLRSYGPLVVVAVAFLLMAATVPPTERAHQAYAGQVEVPTFGPATQGGETGPEGEGEGGDEGAQAVDGSGLGTGEASGGTSSGDGGSSGSEGGGSSSGVSPCTDRTHQVVGDPYSPPCYAFAGDNGGATHQGVTAEDIVVSVRLLEGPTAAEIFADISGQAVSDSTAAYQDTVVALAEYFSERFQLYGRKIRVEFYRGEGAGASELLGGGKERALADAVRASKEIGAFADVSAITIPYADALARQGIVNIGAPYPSREWFEARRPFSWSLFPDGTNVVEAGVASFKARFPPGSTADHAGPAFQGQPRVFGVVAPENQEYQESAQAFIREANAAGLTISTELRYKLDISSMPNQASNIVAQLKDRGVTTVICACDPVMLALGMTPKANEQRYEPEWLTSGLAFVDQDIVGQLIDSKQWSRSFGIAYNAEPEPLGASYPYNAYKQVRPNDEPAFGVEELYYQMYLLALGIQLAGPNLTPETFEAGMYAYPGGSGPRGLWGFGPGDHTPTDDFREIWWDPNRISGQNNKPGTWVQLNGGARWSSANPPQGPAGFFEEG